MRPPAFWIDDAPRGSGRLTRALLTPLSLLYAAAGRRRIAKTIPARAPIPVLCVGNLTLGGTGKTPIVQAALEALREAGLRPAALSRGYGGRQKGPLRVDPETHDAADVGDEPLLLAREARAYISRDRPAGAALAAAEGADVLILDDGHQNPTLLKDLSLVVVDNALGWGPGQVFPAGPLREPVQAGLARADAVIVMTSGPEDPPNHRQLALEDFEKPVLTAWLAPTAAPPTGPLLAFAGIGRPQKVFDALAAAGGLIAATAAFPDHHPYRAGELSTLADLAEAHGARLITTEKDWVRLSPDWRAQVTAWPVRAAFAEPARFADLLLTAVDRARPER